MGRNLLLILIFAGSSASAQYNIFHENGSAGIKDESGKEIIPADYEDLGWSSGASQFHEDVIGYKKDGKWGLISRQNQAITPPLYHQIVPNQSSLVVASKKGNFSNQEFFGIINTSGKLVIPFAYAGLEVVGDAIIAQKTEYNRRSFGLIGLDHIQRLPFQYSRIYPISDKLLLVEKSGNLMSIVDMRGKSMTTHSIDSISAAAMEGYFITWRNGKKGLLDKQGNEMLAPLYKRISFTSNSVDALQFNTWSFFKEEGTILEQMQFDQITEVGPGIYIVSINSEERIYNALTQTITRGFDEITQVDHQLFKTRKGKKFGLHAFSGPVIPESYDSLHCREGFVYAFNQRKHVWSLLDTEGAARSSRKYADMRPGNENRFPVKRNGKWGFIDQHGDEVVHCVYDKVSDFRFGKATVRFHNELGVIDKQGNWVVFPNKGRRTLTLVNDSLFLETRGQQSSLMSFNGTLIYFTSNPVEVRSHYLLETMDSLRTWRISFQGTIFDREVEKEIHEPIAFRDSLFIVSNSEFKGVVKSDGETLIPIEYEDILTSDSEFIAVKKDGYWGFVDFQNRLRIANRYDEVKPFSEGLAAVRIRKRWGFIDLQENIAVQPMYERAESFRNGVALIETTRGYGFINHEVNEVVASDIDHIQKEGSAWIFNRDGKYGLIDERGKIVLQGKYQSIEPIASNQFIVKRKGKYGVSDTHGVMLMGFNYDHLEYHPTRQLFVAKVEGEWISLPLHPN